jgi:hypothetical protein
MGYRLWVIGYGIWVMGYGLWVMGYGLWVRVELTNLKVSPFSSLILCLTAELLKFKKEFHRVLFFDL